MSPLTTPDRTELAAVDPSADPSDDDPSDEEFDKRAWRWAVVLLQLSLISLVAFHLLHGDGRAGASGAATTVEARKTFPDDAVRGFARIEARDAEGAAGTTDRARRPQRVAAVLRADFTKGDPWPVGAASRDTAGVSWPMGIVHQQFVHGPAVGGKAVSWLARSLGSDVRVMGARVRFAATRPGEVALTAWQTSVLDESGHAVPRTGMRLVAGPGHWRLVAIDRAGTAALASGRYLRAGLTASYELVRKGADVWVTDPTGTLTHVSDPRVAALAGPWASWELRDLPGTTSAGIEEIWAG